MKNKPLQNQQLQNQHFSRFHVEWAAPNGKDNISVFGIPKNREVEFVQNPILAFQSLDAKELYRIPVNEYAMNQQLHDAQVEIQFDHYANHMIHLMGRGE